MQVEPDRVASLKREIERLLGRHLINAEAKDLERLAYKIMIEMESAETAQGDGMEMIPARPDVEIQWITGKIPYGREVDVKKLGVNQHGEESDYYGRGGGTDADDGRGAIDGIRAQS